MTKVIAITGWDRSGSTIVAAALGSVPGILTLGEVTNVWERGFDQNQVCSCGEQFSSCDLWGPLAHRAFGDAIDSVPERARSAMNQLGNASLAQRQLRGTDLDPAAGAAYRELLDRVYSAGAELTGAKVLVDSSKKPWHTAMAEALTDFDVLILHVIRDPRGVAFSFQKQVAYDSDQQMARHSPTFSSLAWLYRNWLTESRWRESGNYLRVRYEDFVSQPRSTLAAVFEMVELDLPMPLTDDDRLVLQPSHNIAGNPARFETGTIELRLDDAWREQLPTPTRRYVSGITAWQRRRYGYR